MEIDSASELILDDADEILSRYRNWLRQYTNDADEDVRLRSSIKAVVDLERLDARLRLLLPDQNLDGETREDRADVDFLSTKEIYNSLTSILMTRCTEQLKPIRAVASQLRTTTGSTSTHSAYIQSVFRPVQTAVDEFPSFPAESVSRSVAKEVFVQFGGMLMSVRKTEDLLRRHRKSRKTGFSLFASGDTAEDEEKRFDQQMRVDIEKLGKEAELLGLQVEDLAEWRELRGVMDRAVEA